MKAVCSRINRLGSLITTESFTIMKRLVLLFLLAAAPSAFAQQDVLFDGSVEMGGYGGPSVRLGEFNGTPGLLVGGMGGWLIDHRLTIGAAGYGLATVVEPTLPGGDTLRLDLGYGGGFIDYQFFPDNVIHAGAHVLVGAGGIDYTRRGQDHDNNDHLGVGDAFFIVEPGISAEVNILRNLRLQATASYRVVSGVETPGTSNEDLSGPSAGLTLKIGSF